MSSFSPYRLRSARIKLFQVWQRGRILLRSKQSDSRSPRLILENVCFVPAAIEKTGWVIGSEVCFCHYKGCYNKGPPVGGNFKSASFTRWITIQETSIVNKPAPLWCLHCILIIWSPEISMKSSTEVTSCCICPLLLITESEILWPAAGTCSLQSKEEYQYES